MWVYLVFYSVDNFPCLEVFSDEDRAKQYAHYVKGSVQPFAVRGASFVWG